jgi:hypothetical protein
MNDILYNERYYEGALRNTELACRWSEVGRMNELGWGGGTPPPSYWLLFESSLHDEERFPLSQNKALVWTKTCQIGSSKGFTGKMATWKIVAVMGTAYVNTANSKTSGQCTNSNITWYQRQIVTISLNPSYLYLHTDDVSLLSIFTHTE